MSTTRLGPLQWGIILLTVATAVIHLYLGIRFSGPLFILNGIGYLALLAGLYLPQFSNYRSIIRWALILFTATTIIAWVIVARAQPSPLGIADKLIEAALIVLLFIEGRR